MYPNLFYPELYLIEGGYKAFFGKCKVMDILDIIKVAYFAVLPESDFELQNCALLT